MMTVWCVAVAHAGWVGGGVYADGFAGGGWTDRVGPVTRGVAGSLGFGGYFGNYRGTYRFGDYWRFGVAVQWNQLYTREGGVFPREEPEFVEAQWLPTVEIGRGGDVMNLGAYWVLGVGPVVLSDSKRVGDPHARLAVGAGANGSLVSAYNVGRSLSVTLRLTAGLQYVGEVSVNGGMAFGVLLRAPVVPLRDLTES